MINIGTIMIAVIVVMIGGWGYLAGRLDGKQSQCNTMNAELYKDKCVIVERKEVKL